MKFLQYLLLGAGLIMAVPNVETMKREREKVVSSDDIRRQQEFDAYLQEKEKRTSDQQKADDLYICNLIKCRRRQGFFKPESQPFKDLESQINIAGKTAHQVVAQREADQQLADQQEELRRQRYEKMKTIRQTPTQPVAQEVVTTTTTNPLDLFLERYAPPADLCVFIEQNKENKRLGWGTFGKLQGFPGIFKKGKGVFGIERLINAERLRKCIEIHNLFCLKVPRKYVYRINDEIFVFAECIGGGSVGNNVSNRDLTLEEIKQLTILIEETGFSDIHSDNIIRDNENKLVFIDTESKSFSMGWGLKSKCIELLSQGFRGGFGEYFIGKGKMTTEAQAWLKTRHLELLNGPTESNKTVNYPGGEMDPETLTDPLFKDVLSLLSEES